MCWVFLRWLRCAERADTHGSTQLLDVPHRIGVRCVCNVVLRTTMFVKLTTIRTVQRDVLAGCILEGYIVHSMLLNEVRHTA